MKYYPVFLDIRGKSCLVVGGGNVARRKVKSLLDAGAVVKVISPELISSLKSLVENGKIKYLKREFRKEDLKGSAIVIVATGDRELNWKIYREATRFNILCNVVDDPELCHFTVPSSISRGDLQIAVSTSGKSPTLAREIRKKLEKIFGREYEKYLNLMGEIRTEVLQQVASPAKRKKIFDALSRSRILSHLKRGKMREASRESRRIIQKHL
ncbi:MAG: bifunctional precorrin-2 dehydrogenase/sirohydrochlorin ferrochelatase [Acidobacteriota bacterium]